METVNGFLIRVFWKAFGIWAGRPGNEDRLAATFENIIESVVAGQEAAAAEAAQ